MRYHAIAIILLMISASLAGCTADEGSSNDDVDDTVENIGGTSNETINQTTNDTAGNETTDGGNGTTNGGNGTTSGCTALFQIAETAIHSPGNTSWTNNTYDSNCGKINTTITGLFDLDMGDYRLFNKSIDYDSSGNIAFTNYSGGSANNTWEYHYDTNGNLISIVKGVAPQIAYENYSYDSSGREIMVVYQSGSNGETYAWENTTYNSNGQISETSMATPSGSSDVDGTVTHYYDSNNVLNYTITSSSEWSSDPFYTNYTYDSQGRVIQLKSEPSWGEIFINTSYDASGQISEVTETWDTNPGSEWDVHYHYIKTYTWGQI